MCIFTFFREQISSTGIDSDRIPVCKVAVLEDAVFLRANT